MKRFYYYARLNDNNVCTEIVSRVNKLKDVKGYVELPEYNETVRYKKWENNQWSQESYEPELDTVIQDKIEKLESAAESQDNIIENILDTNERLVERNKQLEGVIMELTTVLSTMQEGE